MYFSVNCFSEKQHPSECWSRDIKQGEPHWSSDGNFWRSSILKVFLARACFCPPTPNLTQGSELKVSLHGLPGRYLTIRSCGELTSALRFSNRQCFPVCSWSLSALGQIGKLARPWIHQPGWWNQVLAPESQRTPGREFPGALSHDSQPSRTKLGLSYMTHK